MVDKDLKRQLQELTERLAKIEAHLGMEESEKTPPEVKIPEVITPEVTTPEVTHPKVTIPEIEKSEVTPKEIPPPVVSPPPVIDKGVQVTKPATPHGTTPIAPITKPQTPLPTSPPTSPSVKPQAPPVAAKKKVPAHISSDRDQKKDTPSRSLEQLIGGKFMACVGAIVIVIGTGFLAKTMDIAGWWGALQPIVKCMILASFGGLLIGAGEFVFRKVGRTAAVGLFAAGLGTLYLTAYTTFKPYDLLDEAGAFILLGIVAALGFGITLRTKTLTTGVLSLVGGYIAPVLLSDASTFPAAMPLYLSALLGISLALSAFAPKPFRPLRYVALVGQGLLAWFWVLPLSPQPWQLFVVFGAIWWVMVLAESVYAAHRNQSQIGNIAASLFSTAWYVTTTCWLLSTPNAAANTWLGAFTLGIAVIAAATALQFGPGLDALRGQVNSAIDKLSVALWAQVGILIPVAVALQFEGYGQSISWLAIGVVSIEIGRRLPSLGVDIFGLIVGGLGLARVATYDMVFSSQLHRTFFENEHIAIAGWTVLALFAVSALIIAAHRARSSGPKPWRTLPIVLMTMATVSWMILCLMHCDNLTATTGWLFGAIALLGLRSLGERQQYFKLSQVLIAGAAIKWVVVDTLLLRTTPLWNHSDMLPFLNQQMLTGLAIAAVGFWFYFVQKHRLATLGEGMGGIAVPDKLRGPVNQLVSLLPVAISILIIWGISFEVDRILIAVQQAADESGTPLLWPKSQLLLLYLIMLWGAGAMGMYIVGVVRKLEYLAIAGYGILIGAGGFWMVFGTAILRLASEPINSPLFLNPQALIGISLIALLAIHMLIQRSIVQKQGEGSIKLADVRLISSSVISLMTLWIISFEFDRFIQNSEWVERSLWDDSQLLMLGLTLVWAFGAAIVVIVGRLRSLWPLEKAGFAVLAFTAMLWLTVDTLLPRLSEGVVEDSIILNPQFGVGIAIAALIAVVIWIDGKHSMNDKFLKDQISKMQVVYFALIALIGLWLGSLELDRFIHTSDWVKNSIWDDSQLLMLGLTLVWAIGAAVVIIVGKLRSLWPLVLPGFALLAFTAMLWLTVNTLFPRLAEGVVAASIILNPQFGVGIAIAAILAVVIWFDTKQQAGDVLFEDQQLKIHIVYFTLIALIGVWLGSLEIDRYCDSYTNVQAGAMARQTGFSIYWGIYGIALVATGFWQRIAFVRYSGLALLSITLVKVGLIDTAQLEGIYRPMSYIAIGLLFVITSVGYAKLSPRILALHAESSTEDDEVENVNHA